MRNLLLGTLCLTTLAVAPRNAVAVADVQTEQLQAKVKQLEAQVKSLQAEVARLKSLLESAKITKENPKAAAEARRLADLYRALQKDPRNRDLRERALVLAKKLALARPLYRIAWHVLLTGGALMDSMSLADAEKLLGPRTDDTKGSVGWYFNPNHRLHVAPYLTAQKTQHGLSGWKIVNR